MNQPTEFWDSYLNNSPYHQNHLDLAQNLSQHASPAGIFSSSAVKQVEDNNPNLYVSNIKQLNDPQNYYSKQDDCEKYLDDQLNNMNANSNANSIPISHPTSNSTRPFSPSESSVSDHSNSVSNTSTNINGVLQLSEEEIIERKKAQNRAAQRAFRERKEGKLKDLSEKLSNATSMNDSLMKQLEELKQQNALLGMENQMLQRRGGARGIPGDAINTTNNPNNAISNGNMINDENGVGCANVMGSMNEFDVNSAIESQRNTSTVQQATQSNFSFPISKKEFINTVAESHIKEHFINTDLLKSLNYKETDNGSEDNLLTISAVWDYLNELSSNYEDLEFNIVEIMNQLKGNEKCHGYGPAYPLKLVNEVIKRNIS